MDNKDSVQRMKTNRDKEKKAANQALVKLAQNRVELKRPVFFVPGWTDEDCKWWTLSCKKNPTIQAWLTSNAVNPQLANYVNFTDVTEKCKSFYDFGKILKGKILEFLGNNKICGKIDLVGHSMGGLDVIASVLNDTEPLLNVHNLITVASPLKGTDLAGFRLWDPVKGLIDWADKPMSKHHASQLRNLDPDSPAIISLNQLDTRTKLLNRVDRFFCLKGTLDAAVMKSAAFKSADLNRSCSNKIEVIPIGGAMHTELAGITQDVRTILYIIQILQDIPIKKRTGNKGTLVGGIYVRNDWDII